MRAAHSLNGWKGALRYMQKIKQNFPSSRRAFLEQKLQGLIYYTIPAFEQTGLVKHGFSTRLGGVSKGSLQPESELQAKGQP